MNTTETKVKLVKGNSVIYATLRKGEFKRFTKDGETVCDGEFQNLGGAPETRHGDYAAVKRLFHEFVGAKCVDGYTVEGSAAAALGRMGGASTSPAKQAASRANGAKGGRPRVPRVGETFAGVRQALALRVIAVDGTNLTYDLIDRASGESVLGGVPRTRKMVAAAGGESANHPVHYWIEHETGEVWHLLRPIA